MSNDVKVIERVLSGDVESFRVLVQKYEKPLLQFVSNLLPDAIECEDILQDVFLSAYANLRTFAPGRAAFSTWLYTIARNRCVNALKKRRPRSMYPLPEIADASSPHETATRNEVFHRLDTALHELPLEQKTAFVLYELQGLSYREIGVIEGVSMGTLKSRLSRAKQKLRRALEHFAEPPS